MSSIFHGGARPSEYDMIDFSSNVNPYIPEFLNEIKYDFSRYPYCSYIEDMIKEKFKIDYDVIFSAGITELLYQVGYAFSGKVARFMDVTYKEYERIADLFNMKKDVLENIDPYPSELIKSDAIVFISNPNNPTGKYIDLDDIVQTAERKNSIVILDEAYIDFSDIKKENYSDNIIVLRSLTKQFGVPGIRAGYAFGNKKYIEKMREFSIPWSMGITGCKFAEYAIKNYNFVYETVEYIKKEKKRFENIFNIKSDANFFLVTSDKIDLFEYLRKNKILVRNCESFGLKGYIRFSIRKKEENDLLINLLKGMDIRNHEGIKYGH
ncbi:MAG: aminotransferase class I/II-fold pyridoxal phosphate-dependent enzyme [Thermoplasmata archaeon]